MVGTLFSFMAMAIGGRELASELTTFQILFFRSLIGLFIICGLVLASRKKQLFSRHIGLHLVRNIAHFCGQFGWFYGIASISLAKVFAIEFTLPVWTALLAAVILNEKLTMPRIIAVLFGLAGMLIILRPGLGVMNLASLAVLASAVCYGLSHTLTRKITQYDSPIVILFFMTAIQLPIGFCLSIGNWHTPSLALWPWLLVVGTCALSGHYCMARALGIAPATVVVPMDFLRLPLISIVGFFFYNEKIDEFIFFGALVMLTGNLINIKAEQTAPDHRIK
ncbi:MAG: DMT family transporter [Proteobacteria bacterium]|nr:DMT family transporter [Pseudomonadota bacterium]MBU1583921.1 DMT family transporter [Pseudomonadota bacterium]MBU2629445.1 DMT family transporter [Pseudomonadota bacterium]